MKKFDEVLGMITFANEIITHMNQMGAAVDKEKAKRLQAEQSQTESDKLEVHFILSSLDLARSVWLDKSSFIPWCTWPRTS